MAQLIAIATQSQSRPRPGPLVKFFTSRRPLVKFFTSLRSRQILSLCLNLVSNRDMSQNDTCTEFAQCHGLRLRSSLNQWGRVAHFRRSEDPLNERSFSRENRS